MLRYFYLLCLLLLAINCSFCYDSISDRHLKHKHDRRFSKKDKFQHHKQKLKAVTHYVHTKKHDYDIPEDKDPIAQIDVASFIQKPDEYAVDDNFNFELETKKSKAKLNNYGYGSFMYNADQDVEKRSNKRPYNRSPGADKLDSGLNLFSLKNINSQHLNLDGIHGLNNGKIGRNPRKSSTSGYEHALYVTDSNIAHNPEKKCILKNMVKIPFFSHSKNESAKAKRAKKRKVFCFNCSNQKEKENKSGEFSTTETLTNQDLETPKVILADTREGEQDMKSSEVKKDKRELWLNDRDRQLKELEEIQKKVDNVEILPTFDPFSHN